MCIRRMNSRWLLFALPVFFIATNGCGETNDVGASESSSIAKKTESQPADTNTNAEQQPTSVVLAEPKNEQLAKPKLAVPTSTSWASFRNGPQQLGVAGCKLPKKLELIWKRPTIDGIVAPAAIVGKHAYVPELNGYLRCLELATGNLVWSYRSIEDPDPEQFAPGFKAAPTVTADTIYLGDEDGTLHVVDRATGKKKWTFTTGAEITGGVTLFDDRVLFGSHDNFLYCLNNSDQSVVWKFATEAQIFSSPAISGQATFLAGCDEHLRVIDISSGTEQSHMPMDAYIAASPAVPDDVLYVGTAGAEVIAYNWKEQKILWRYKDPNREFPYHASAAVTDNYVVVGGRDKQMHCINRKTGVGVWKFQARGRIDSSPVIVGERVFFGSADRNLYELSLKDGKRLWKFNAGGDISAAPAVGEGYLIIGAEGGKGEIFCFGRKQRRKG